MLTEEEATKKAESTLRFDIGGNLPHLSDPKFSDKQDSYVYLIKLSYPRMADPDDPDDELTFDMPEAIGEIIVDANTGDIRHTPEDVLQERAGDIKQRPDHERRTRHDQGNNS